MRRKPLFPPPKDPQTGKNLRHKGRQQFSLLTVNGRVCLQRIRWHGPGVGSCTPLDRYLDQAEQTVSVGVRELACRLNGASTNFERTAENLARAAQIFSSGETLRVLIEHEGRQVLHAQQSNTLPLPWSADECHADPDVPTSPSRVYLGADGVMVPTVTDQEKRKRRDKIKAKRRRRGRTAKPLPRAKAGTDESYKEFKIVVFYDEMQDHRLAVGTKGDCVEAGRQMRRQAARLHLDRAAEKIGNVDGSPWIRNQIESQSLPLDALGLDFFHLAENVHKARRAVYGDDDSVGHEWASAVLHCFKHEGYQASWEQLVDWRAGWRRGAQRQAADILLNYVSERQAMILYPEFVSHGWQIGSGPTEAMCKTLTARLKGGGKRWDPSNAEAVMALEALRQSGLWKSYWQTLLPAAA